MSSVNIYLSMIGYDTHCTPLSKTSLHFSVFHSAWVCIAAGPVPRHLVHRVSGQRIHGERVQECVTHCDKIHCGIIMVSFGL